MLSLKKDYVVTNERNLWPAGKMYGNNIKLLGEYQQFKETVLVPFSASIVNY